MPVLRMIDRTHSDHRFLFQLKCRFCVSCLGKRISDQIHTAAARRHPADTTVILRRIVFVFPGADSDLPHVIHSGPYEITDNPWILLCCFPEIIGVRAEGLASQNQAIRVFS